LQAYQEIQPEIKALGASMVAISPQKAEYSLSMAQKHELGFEVLSDEGNRVAREYGLVFELDPALQELYKTEFKTDLAEYNADGTYELPLPGTFIVAPDGIISFAFVEVDYTRRMEPADILDHLKKIKK
jgi:peroxiredoxin